MQEADGTGLQSDETSESKRLKELQGSLEENLMGEVCFDRYTQVMYSTDGSIYQARPAGVVYPSHRHDVISTMEIAAEHYAPVLPRGAGSSLSGQAVGPGCIVMDLSRYMNNIKEINPVDSTATVQPGVVLDDLNDEAANHGLKFAPDPASSNRATIGGAIGNNSTGAHSVRYGLTDEYIEELEVVLIDGSVIHTRELVLDGFEYRQITQQDDLEARIYESIRGIIKGHSDEIGQRYPELKRCVSGYNLHKVIYTNNDGDRVINLSKLFAGSEGTLGVVTEATVSLVSEPKVTTVALYCYEDLLDALKAVPVALEQSVSAVELMDSTVFDLARESEGYSEYTELIPEGTQAALMVEWDSELVLDFEDRIKRTNDEMLVNGEAFDVVEAYSDEEQEDLWSLRKAAIPLLMSLEGDAKPYPFIEDATVPPEELAEYVEGFQEILERHDTEAAYFAHAGSGTLHIRPILSLKEENGIEKMRSISEDVTDVVLEHHGAFSGEHGDGMSRTMFNPKMYGSDLWRAFKEIKTVFDPSWLLNPGNVVYRDSKDDIGPENDRGVGADMTMNLRYGSEYKALETKTELDFKPEGGFNHLVELCNGCGTCRKTGSDVMCPTYRASKQEIQSTRGRANLLRAAISGEIPRDEMYSEEFQSEVMDLCIGCKGCKNDCPTGVDLAKLKAEVKHRYHQRNDPTFRDRFFRDIDRYLEIGVRYAPLSNILTKIPGTGYLMEKATGISRKRRAPRFESKTFTEIFRERGGSSINEVTAWDRVVLIPGMYTEYIDHEPGIHAVRLLESINIHVEVPDIPPTGRAAYSMGFLDESRSRARGTIEELVEYLGDGYSFVFLEPSDAVMLQDEYRYLLGYRDLGRDRVNRVIENTYGFMEYMDANDIAGELRLNPVESGVVYHGHCNQKAINKDHHAVDVLREIGYDVDIVDSTCCGMAGSFGYEEEHYDLSISIGELLAEKIERSRYSEVVTPGMSCISQIRHVSPGVEVKHPVTKVTEKLSNPGD